MEGPVDMQRTEATTRAAPIAILMCSCHCRPGWIPWSQGRWASWSNCDLEGTPAPPLHGHWLSPCPFALQSKGRPVKPVSRVGKRQERGRGFPSAAWTMQVESIASGTIYGFVDIHG